MNGEFLRGLLVVLLLLAGLGWPIWATIRSAEDPARMAFRWIITVPILAFLFLVVGRVVGRGGYVGAFAGIPATAVCGIILAVIWGRSIGSLVSKPFTSMFTGGSTPLEPQPFYSIARALRKKGKPLEAIVEIRQQLQLSRRSGRSFPVGRASGPGP